VKNDAGVDFSTRLNRRLAGARRIAVVGIGDELLPNDRLGMLAAREIEQLNLSGVKVFFAGTMPESMTGPLREFHPDHILMIDAADMSSFPGTLAIIKPGRIQASLFSTHALPLSAVIEFIERDIQTKVTLVGIQPETENVCPGLSDREKAGVSQLLASISRILKQTPDVKP
jgi:hydrogenase 3 maturation protease